ncbi:hypothetical protein SLEP1_g37884 [Rubroshorea leprosula]|uniref:Reverse transcriptase Ty1/copia-type domain-containing protein n=1 Tax=Rubroshorea leprosula TaxID=152421 RepID=A0AAV5KW52_9ROSI|nr:hypothetical protein SLEP1_g37884 [Rubroshorea leprosula]
MPHTYPNFPSPAMPSTGPTCPGPPSPGPTSHQTTTPTSPTPIAPTSLLPVSASIVPSPVPPPAVSSSPFLPDLHSTSPSCGVAPLASARSGFGPDASLSAASIGDCTGSDDCSVSAPAATLSSSVPSTSSTNVPRRTHGMVTRSQAGVRKPKILPSLLHTSTDLQEPRTFKQACNLPEWQRAVQEEFLALQRNHTWVLVSPPSSANIVGSKWVYRIKQRADGSIERYKARLVAQGYTQQPGIDYDETFSPVVKPLPFAQFLHLLFPSLGQFINLMLRMPFSMGIYLSLFICLNHLDLLIRSIQIVFAFSNELFMAYSDCSMFLYRSNASFNPDGLFLCQTKYIFDLLARTGMSDCNAAATPLSPRQKLAACDSLPYLDSTQYRSIVGALQYLTFTRPDIAFTVHQVCQYMHAPTQNHFQAVKRILRYLKGIAHYGLQLFKAFSPSLHIYTDADWAGCLESRRSTSGYCLFFGKSLISWSSKKQNIVARSSVEAEYRAMANAVAEVVWVQQLLAELQVFLSSAPIVLCDNISALYLALNPIQHQ